METKEPKKTSKALVAIPCLFVILGCLYYVGIFNPWRILRQAKTYFKLRSSSSLDTLESNPDGVASISIWHLQPPLSPDKQRRVVDILRHLGPYDDKGKFGSYSPGDPRNARRTDQLSIRFDKPFEDWLLLYVNELSPTDRDAIREVTGDPAQYGITDNSRILSVR